MAYLKNINIVNGLIKIGLAAQLVTFVGCTSHDKADQSAPLEGTSALTMLFNENVTLQGDPKVYSFKITTSAGVVVERGGNLPAPGQAITLYNLPNDTAATVTAGLYTLNIEERFQTHSCQSETPVTLEPGVTTSIAVVCTPVTTVANTQPVKVFLKIAKGSVTISEGDADLAIKQRDLEAPMVLSHIDSRKRRITIRQSTAGLTFNLGGEIGYFAAKTDPNKSVLTQLFEGEEITMKAISGSLVQSVPEDAVLKMTGPATLFEAEDGSLKIALSFDLTNSADTAGFNGTLFEEGPQTEFTVVSYNVENLFDQQDDTRNAHYGDYRIAANDAGQSSNWGEPVLYNGVMSSFTDVKVDGVRKALQAVDPAGPEIVGLVEIESKDALNAVFEHMKDLGYVTAAFSEWTPDMTPTAIGMGLISKFPAKATELLKVSQGAGPIDPNEEPTRPILKVTLDVSGYDLIVYVNHWKSKGGPESKRQEYARAIEADLQPILAANPKADYIILGDLNSNYNEDISIADSNNDTNNVTGINEILNTTGNELEVAKQKSLNIKYNLQYELDRAARRSAWHFGYGWSSLDHIIVSPGLFDMVGVTYVDNSFEIAAPYMDRYAFLFNEDGTTKRWIQTREANNFTRHQIGGYSDHLPISARFRIAPVQDSYPIYLYQPSRADKTDPVTN